MITKTIALVFKYWMVASFVVIATGAAAYVYSTFNDDKYVCSLTFVVDEASATGGGLGSIVGRLGLGSLNPTGVNLERVIEFSKSKFVTKKVLEDSIYVNSDSFLLANYLISYYEFKELWADTDNTKLKSFDKFNSEINLEDRTESQIFQTLHSGINYGILSDEPLISISFNSSTGIFSVNASTKSEELSYSITRSYYEKLKNVYTDQAREKDILIVRALESKKDSLNEHLATITSAYNRELDRSSNIILSSSRQKASMYERDMFQTSLLLQEVVQNAEISNFKLLTFSPAFKVIDYPYFPLKKVKVSKMRFLIAGFILGGIICFLIAISKVAYSSYKFNSIDK